MTQKPSASQWEASGSKYRAMTAGFDLGVEPHDHFTWCWWVRDADFGDVVAKGHASDLATAQAAAVQVGLLMELDC